MTTEPAFACKQNSSSFYKDNQLIFIKLVIFILIFCMTGEIYAQDTIPVVRTEAPPATQVVTTDSLLHGTIEKPPVSPIKATMLSATLPGLGQIYNGKVWKVPFIYAGFGGIVYAFNFNNKYYQRYRRAWVAAADGNPNTTSEYPNISADRLLRATNYYRRNLELTYIVAAVFYALNILDASVDAHLMNFDVSPELSLKLQPAVFNDSPAGFAKSPATGFSLSLRF